VWGVESSFQYLRVKTILTGPGSFVFLQSAEKNDPAMAIKANDANIKSPLKKELKTKTSIKLFCISHQLTSGFKVLRETSFP